MKKQAKPLQPSDVCKNEPSTSIAPLHRLPSLQPPKDLTLSAYCKKLLNPNASKIKKIYIPNLNVQRNRDSESVSSTAKSDPVEPTTLKTHQSKDSHSKGSFVQLNLGVFSHGIPGQKNCGRSHSVRGKSVTKSALVRPVLNLQENLKTNKKEEEAILKNLLCDDFIDDPALRTDLDKPPIVLPGAKEYAVLNKNRSLGNDGIEEKRTVQDVFCTTDSNPGFILFQLPNSMPVTKSDPSEEESKHNSTSTSSGDPTEQKIKIQPSSELSMITSLPDGQIGKLQILRSGKARLLLGDIVMCVEMGTQVTFKQDVVSANLDKATNSGDLMNIGPVKTRMVVTPDWKKMLTSSKAGLKPL